jgi:hypothetical protein
MGNDFQTLSECQDAKITKALNHTVVTDTKKAKGGMPMALGLHKGNYQNGSSGLLQLVWTEGCPKHGIIMAAFGFKGQ